MTAVREQAAPSRPASPSAARRAYSNVAAPRGASRQPHRRRPRPRRPSSSPPRSCAGRTQMPLTVLVLPLVLGSLVLGPRQLPVVRGLGACRADGGALDPAGASPSAWCWRSPSCSCSASSSCSPASAGRGSASPARWASRCWSTCATGSSARAASPTCPTAGTSSPRCARRAARRSPATSSWRPGRARGPPRRRRRRRVRQGRAGRHPGAAALRRVRRPAHRAAGRASSCRAANDYLLRQEWEEGFATAVHLSLDLATGRFEVRTAGHPPAVQLDRRLRPLVGAATPRGRCSG